MDLLGTSINAGVMVLVGLLVTWYTKGRFDALDRRMDRLEGRVDGLDGRIDAMRSDLTSVALAVGVGPKTQAGKG